MPAKGRDCRGRKCVGGRGTRVSRLLSPELSLPGESSGWKGYAYDTNPVHLSNVNPVWGHEYLSCYQPLPEGMTFPYLVNIATVCYSRSTGSDHFFLSFCEMTYSSSNGSRGALKLVSSFGSGQMCACGFQSSRRCVGPCSRCRDVPVPLCNSDRSGERIRADFARDDLIYGAGKQTESWDPPAGGGRILLRVSCPEAAGSPANMLARYSRAFPRNPLGTRQTFQTSIKQRNTSHTLTLCEWGDYFRRETWQMIVCQSSSPLPKWHNPVRFLRPPGRFEREASPGALLPNIFPWMGKGKKKRLQTEAAAAAVVHLSLSRPNGDDNHNRRWKSNKGVDEAARATATVDGLLFFSLRRCDTHSFVRRSVILLCSKWSGNSIPAESRHFFHPKLTGKYLS